MTAGAVLELSVERLTYGPDALARGRDGRVVFLDDGLPGETVRARLAQQRRDFARAEVIEVVGVPPGASPRRQPPCPIVEQCGGCPWQHIEYRAQLEWKLEVALREIERIARVRPATLLPTIPATEWRGRNRIRLAIGREARGAPTRIGYRSRGSHQVVELRDCQIAAAPLIMALPVAFALAQAEPTLHEIEMLLDDRGALMLRLWSHSRSAVDAGGLLETARHRATQLDVPCLAGLRVEFAPVSTHLRHRPTEPSWVSVAGDRSQQIRVAEGVCLEVPLGAFTQVNLEQNRLLVAQVLRAVQPRPGLRVLELYCGAGNFSVPLVLAGAAVHGIEANQQAAAAARANAARLADGGAGELLVLEGDVQRVLEQHCFAERSDLVLLDPPRSGAARAVRRIAKSRFLSVVYVCCDVATFARDAAILRGEGYSFESFQIVDLTPQTYRAEGIGVFRLT